MNIQDIKNKLVSLDEQKEEAISKLKVYVTDKNIPLDERWDVFIKSELGYEEDCIQSFKSLAPVKYFARNPIEDALYENYEKYMTIDVEYLYEELLEEYFKTPKQIYSNGAWYDTGEFNEYGFIGRPFLIDQIYNDPNPVEYTFTQQDADNFREEVLGAFLKSFRFDW